MKIIDTRDQRVMAGELIAVIPANQLVSIADMLRFYRLQPSDRNFALLSAAQAVDRIVLRRGDVEDECFYIVPRYPFYKEVAE